MKGGILIFLRGSFGLVSDTFIQHYYLAIDHYNGVVIDQGT